MEPTQEIPSTSDYPLELGPEAQLPPASVDAETAGFAPETVDLLGTLGDVDQQLLADEVIRCYDRDWKSSEKFRERRTSIVRLFLGVLPQIDEENTISEARVHYPIIATAIQRMHARIYDQQFPANGEFFGVRPLDALDMDRALRVAKHLNWQVMQKIPEYVMNHDVLIMQWLLYGSAFSYLYWDPIKDRPCHEVCRTEDIVLPYTFHSTDPSMSDVPRITRIVRKYRHEIDDLADVGYYRNIDLIDEKEAEGQTTSTGQGGFMANVSSSSGGASMRETIDKAQGIEKPSEESGPEGSKDGPRVLLEQHRYWKLPGEKRQRPIIATVDKETKILVGLRIREDEDPQDRARYNREMAANRASYDAAMQQYAMNMAQYQNPGATPTMPPMDGTGTVTQPPMPGEETLTMPGLTPAPPPPPPMPPDPLPPKMVPINFFTHYVCIPNPEGILGFGIGYLLEGHNMVADIIASQIVDAGTLANTSTFIFSRQAKMKRGDLVIRPGEGTEVDLSPQDVDKGIKMLQFPGPDAQLAQFIRDQKEEASELSGANEILSGEVGGSNETATTTQIRISQALAAISILNKRYTRARTFEGKALARLNSVHLEDKEFFTVVDPFKAVPPSMGGMPPGGSPPGVPPQGGAPGGPGGAAPPVAPSAGPGSPPPPAQAPVGGGPGAPTPPPPPGMMVQSPAPMVMEQFVGRVDYLEDVDITVTADPRMASQAQRMQEAQTVMNIINGNPITAQMVPLVLAGMKLNFQALDRPDMVAALEQGAMMMQMQMAAGAPPPGGPGQPPSGGGGGPPQAEAPASNEPFMGQGE